MASNAYNLWAGDRATALDEIEQAHAAVGGAERGRRYATQQINFAYAMLLSSQFQGFCRDLHTESVNAIVSTVPQHLAPVVYNGLIRGRGLDRGNPNPGHIGADFGRLVAPGTRFWDLVDGVDGRSERRRERLKALCEWRNAIAHNDFANVGDAFLRKTTVQEWRRSCTGLARTFDRVLRGQLTTLLGNPPW